MNKSILLIPVFIGLSLSLGFYFGSKQSVLSEEEKKLVNVLNVLEQEYVDTINKNTLVETAIQKTLTSLDPHSIYLPAEQNQIETEQLRGDFAGVGVKFMMLSDTLVVTNVIKDGPSYLAGLKNGDRILKVDTSVVSGANFSTSDVIDRLKGPVGTKVRVEIKRDNIELEREIIRGVIPIPSVRAAVMINENVGYLKLDRFSATSYNEFYLETNKLLRKGMDHLLFDLRGNGGGYLPVACQIIDEFLEGGKLIVFTKGRDGIRDKTYSTDRGRLKNIKLSILIDSESASASEIVAGAIQDNDRGIIFGRRSFGKGLVQSPITLKDNSQIRITVARYYTPTGRCVQKEYDGNYENYVMESYDRYKNGEMFELDSSLFVDSLKFTTPNGKVVYGGGGITPDVFLPYDTTGFSNYYRMLSYSNVFSEFSIKYLDNNRKKWSTQPLRNFVNQFFVSDQLLQDFIAFSSDKGIEFNQEGFNLSKEKIKEQIKINIASNIWDDYGRFYVLTKTDEDIKRVLSF